MTWPIAKGEGRRLTEVGGIEVHLIAVFRRTRKRSILKIGVGIQSLKVPGGKGIARENLQRCAPLERGDAIQLPVTQDVLTHEPKARYCRSVPEIGCYEALWNVVVRSCAIRRDIGLVRKGKGDV